MSDNLPYVAAKIHRTIDDILPWFDGSGTPPAYLPLTLRAIRAGHKPAKITRMNDPNLSVLLCVPSPIVAYWHRAQQYPMAARFAVAAIDQSVEKLTQHELRILGRVIVAKKLYRRTGGYRAAADGLRLVRKHTVANLIRLGFLQERDGELTATPKGHDRWFIR
jgi:hypothetical protein